MWIRHALGDWQLPCEMESAFFNLWTTDLKARYWLEGIPALAGKTYATSDEAIEAVREWRAEQLRSLI